MKLSDRWLLDDFQPIAVGKLKAPVTATEKERRLAWIEEAKAWMGNTKRDPSVAPIIPPKPLLENSCKESQLKQALEMSNAISKTLTNGK